MRATVRPGGALRSSKFRTNDRPTCAKDSARPRPVSTITSMSFMNWSMSKKAETGAQALVRRFRASITDAPQLGWHPQLSCPKEASGALRWSAREANETPDPSGNQSRSGSILPS